MKINKVKSADGTTIAFISDRRGQMRQAGIVADIQRGAFEQRGREQRPGAVGEIDCARQRSCDLCRDRRVVAGAEQHDARLLQLVAGETLRQFGQTDRTVRNHVQYVQAAKQGLAAGRRTRQPFVAVQWPVLG